MELMKKGTARLIVTEALKRSDVKFEWFPGRRTYRKSGVSGARQEYYMLHVKTREDYERVRKRSWPVGRKKTIVRESRGSHS